MNKVVLTGRITKDPEVRYTQSGIPSVRFTLAVDRAGVRDANGNRQADFISCLAWRQSADFISRYIKKGFMLCIEGRIQTGSFQGQDGQMHYTTEVVVDQVENLQPRDPNAPAVGYQQQPQAQPQYQQNPYQQGMMPNMQNPYYGMPMQQPPMGYGMPMQQDPSVTIKTADFPDFGKKVGMQGNPYSGNLNLLMGVQLDISVVIGRSKKKIKDIMDFGQGTVIELDKQTGAPAEIIVNGQLLAYGDVIVVGDNFGIRVTEIVGAKELLDSLGNSL